MSEKNIQNNNSNKISEEVGKWLGWIGIIVGIIGIIFAIIDWCYWPIYLGIGGLALGIIGLFSPEQTLNWIAIIAGAVSLILGFI